MTTGIMQVELTVDDDLLEKISRHKWNAFKTGHVQSRFKGKIVRLQRFVMDAEDSDGVKRIRGSARIVQAIHITMHNALSQAVKNGLILRNVSEATTLYYNNLL